jgi:hypothetical protein
LKIVRMSSLREAGELAALLETFTIAHRDFVVARYRQVLSPDGLRLRFVRSRFQVDRRTEEVFATGAERSDQYVRYAIARRGRKSPSSPELGTRRSAWRGRRSG